jgi:glycosyltransferase involved in cell wall biosynthesis
VRIDQYLPVFAPHDAIGAHVLLVRRVLHDAGWDSDIYAEVVDASLAGEARPWLEGPARSDPDRLVLYHASTHAPLASWLVDRARRGQRLLVDYHNITPADYFRRWLPAAAQEMVLAREELAQLAPLAELGLADSEFNRVELADLGCPSTIACPLLVDLAGYREPPDPEVLAHLRRRHERGGASWLFVGRLAPNKCQHDIVAAFAVYRRLADPAARLTLIGGATAPRYRSALERMIEELGLEGSVELHAGLPHESLLAHFLTADVMVCLSEHEGFCVPLLEAMELGLPIVAYPAAAVPETVGDAAVLVPDKDPLAVATAVADLLGDRASCQRLVDAGRRRARRWDLTASAGRWVETLAAHLEGGAVARPRRPSAQD